jgi:hypothetical protein
VALLGLSPSPRGLDAAAHDSQALPCLWFIRGKGGRCRADLGHRGALGRDLLG